MEVLDLLTCREHYQVKGQTRQRIISWKNSMSMEDEIKVMELTNYTIQTITLIIY